MPRLLERDGELAVIAAAVSAAAEGRGSALLVEGEAGIGKSALVTHARAAAAEEHGAVVLTAIGSPLEASVGFGLARQLMLPAIAGPDGERLLVGAAGLAGPVLGQAPQLPPGPDAAFSAVHGLVWLVTSLAQERPPLILCVDDLHWGDAPSLRFAAALAGRVDDLPIVLLAAGRPADTPETADAMAVLRRAARPLRPGRLSRDGTGRMLDDLLPTPPAPEFADAVQAETGGVPFLVSALVAAVLRGDLPTDASGARRLHEVGVAEIGPRVAAELTHLSDAGRALAQAIAVVGSGRPLSEAASLADLSPELAPVAADELAAAGLVVPNGDSARFAHPLVAAAVTDTLARGALGALHAKAARAAAAAGDAERAASHLLSTPAEGDPGAVRALREAAAAATARGAPDVAATLLRRALAEPPPGPDQPQVLLETGLAEALTADPRAIGRMAEAAAVHSDPGARLLAGMLRGHALMYADRAQEALEAMTLALAAANGRSSDLVTLSRLERLSAMLTIRTAGVQGRRELAELALPETDPGRSLALGLRALMQSTAGAPALETSAMARDSLAGAPPVPFTTPLQLCAAAALAYDDEFDDAVRWLTTVRDAARAGGHLRVLELAGTWLAWVLQRAGKPREMEEAALDADGADQPPPAMVRLVLSAARAEAALDRGRVAEAAAFADQPFETHPGVARLVFMAELLAARARVRRMEGDARAAVRLARQAGRDTDAWGGASPALSGWRAELSFALAATGEHEEARAAAEEEVAAAQRLGTPRPLARALRALAVATGDRAIAGDALDAARAGAPDLEVARCERLAGDLAREGGDDEAAREHLRAAMDGAWRCGADGLARQARDGLVAAGGRPRGIATTGIDALTAAEARTARLAADGVTNREIAETLFVTLGTVERHLTSAYRKLAIDGRPELAAALERGSTPESVG